MALQHLSQPQSEMALTFPMKTDDSGTDSDYSDLKAMALGIQAWLDDAGVFNAPDSSAEPANAEKQAALSMKPISRKGGKRSC